MTDSRTGFRDKFSEEVTLVEGRMAAAIETIGDRRLQAIAFDALTLGQSNHARGMSKRLRGTLLLLCGEGRLSSVDLGKAAAAAEIVHAASLLVDDIQDQHFSRNGVPALWTVIGRAEAFNVALVLVTVAGTYCSPIQGLAESLLTTVRMMLIGQSKDLRADDQPFRCLKSYTDIVNGKTSALLEFACRTGGSHLRSENLEHLTHFARYLGIAHQIQDDIDDLRTTSQLPGSNVAWFLDVEIDDETRIAVIQSAMALAKSKTRCALEHLSAAGLGRVAQQKLATLCQLVGLRHNTRSQNPAMATAIPSALGRA